MRFEIADKIPKGRKKGDNKKKKLQFFLFAHIVKDCAKQKTLESKSIGVLKTSNHLTPSYLSLGSMQHDSMISGIMCACYHMT